MNVQQIKFDLEASKENLLETILENQENIDTLKVAYAIKEFVRNHDIYNTEKKKALDIISKTQNEEQVS